MLMPTVFFYKIRDTLTEFGVWPLLADRFSAASIEQKQVRLHDTKVVVAC
jgi:hypothetical protein